LSIIVTASRAAGASPERGNAPAAHPQAGSAENHKTCDSDKRQPRNRFPVARLANFQARSNNRFALPSSSRRASGCALPRASAVSRASTMGQAERSLKRAL
jgi:hypothetical protein